ncbi:MAG TPA: hypothetical protein VJR89_01175 [Polyangiales bacterium]|nr:hypothetical protein [Polyangiales bacterium]
MSHEVSDLNVRGSEAPASSSQTESRLFAGLERALQYPLFDALINRRSRRISRGIRSVPAGTLSYSSKATAEPLSDLEEALLILATGVTGTTMPDMPFKTESGEDLVGSPMLEVIGRAASSPDNAQGTHFFMLNDSGTYLLRPPRDFDPSILRGPRTPEQLIALAASCKYKVLDRRLDFAREYPCYFGRNRYVSNVPGSTVLVPVVDLTRQYINGMMYLLNEPDGYRPTFIDDWNLYRCAGVHKWVRSGFLNKDLPIPLGYAGTFRIHVEADLLIQNLLLMIQAMGLGGWVHAAFIGPLLLGDPEYVKKYGPGLGFRYEKASLLRRTVLRPITPLPAWNANPVGLDGVLQGFCPPYHRDMSAAVDALIASKYGPNGVYRDAALFNRVFKDGKGKNFIDEVPHFTPDVIACVKDVCNYIYHTYGRFPAHVDAMYVPGVWVQAHHLDLDYYDALYQGGYSDTQAHHHEHWHAPRA